MILTAHQPVYLPWIGLFHKIAESDLFCYFDIVQYQKKVKIIEIKLRPALVQFGFLWQLNQKITSTY